MKSFRKIISLVLMACMLLSAVPAKAMVPPTTIYFDSLDEIREYFDMSIGVLPGDERAGVQDHCSEEEARAICEAMESLVFPYLETDGKPAELGANWVPYRKILDIIYVVDEIQYRFTYYFFSDYQGEDEEPTVRNVQAGPYELDFKRKEHTNSEYWYLSGVREGTTYVSFWVASDREDCLNYERFRFVHLSELEEENQEPKNNDWLLIAGGILGAIALAGVIILVVIRKRKVKAQEAEQTTDE